MCAAWTPLPVLGVPVESHSLKGMDSLLSIVQMPAGVPVGTLAIGRAGAVNAALLAAAILANNDAELAARLDRLREEQTKAVADATGMTSPLPPNSTIGLVGGGQLGRMSALAAARLGYRCHILTREQDSPASQVSAATTISDYQAPAGLREFAAAVDVISFEFENVSAEGLDLLASLKPVRPSPEILRTSQDRVVEKTFLNGAGVPTAPWARGRELRFTDRRGWPDRAASGAEDHSPRLRRQGAGNAATECRYRTGLRGSVAEAVDPGGIRRLRAGDQRHRGTRRGWRLCRLRHGREPPPGPYSRPDPGPSAYSGGRSIGRHRRSLGESRMRWISSGFSRWRCSLIAMAACW